ncbi:hypothetical protein N7340_09175 [Comamonas aquatica]|jgi:hypothetical protein|uniref:hypothetical protein n=1 Tax=Comamonas aquatica TaxID=225991 RepID=UPI00244B7130|nr:hypothetical protein [Comamonas aquatica]MDH0371944.1 hypothetical protein [Comamonas aquatica]
MTTKLRLYLITPPVPGDPHLYCEFHIGLYDSHEEIKEAIPRVIKHLTDEMAEGINSWNLTEAELHGATFDVFSIDYDSGNRTKLYALNQQLQQVESVSE